MHRLMSTCLFAILSLLAPIASAAEPQITDPSEVIRLAGRVLQYHSFLVQQDQRQRLDELHRQGREASDRMRRAGDDAGRSQAEAERNQAATEILNLLESSPELIRLELHPDRPVLPPLVPVRLPADNGALLIRAELQGDLAASSTHAVMTGVDFSTVESEKSNHTMEIAARGSSLVLIGLASVPKQRISQRLDLKAGDLVFRIPFDLHTPAAGRINLTVLGDDDAPTPAMVRLVWKHNGQTRTIANAVDVQSLFDTQGRRSSNRMLNAPGAKSGEYYCMPEPLDMELPAGEWEIAVRRGLEHVPVYDSFTVSAGQTVRKTYQPKRWEDMRKRGWWSGDDHVHAQILSDADARKLMAYARAEDVHLCNVVKMGDIFRTWFDQRGFGPEFRVVQDDYVLAPGQECPRTHAQIGHTISMNIRRMIRDTDQYYLYDKVFDQVHADGGLCGYAHVNSVMFHVYRDMSINIPKGKVDFAEVLQFADLGVDLWYRFLNAGFKLTASAGSDIPWGGTLGEVRVYSYAGHAPFTADAWFNAFGRGRTFVTNGPMLEFTVDEALPGDELQVAAPRKLRVRARAWGDTEHVWPNKLTIVQHGQDIKTVEADQPTGELTIDMAVDSADGFWIAARAWGQNGEHAHTTPVYVVRPGLRFWKHDQVSQLVAQGLSSLEEIEKIVADARERDARGELEDDRTLKQLAIQGPALLERVAEARRIWQDLEKTAEKEASSRKRP